MFTELEYQSTFRTAHVTGINLTLLALGFPFYTTNLEVVWRSGLDVVPDKADGQIHPFWYMYMSSVNTTGIVGQAIL